METRPMDKSFHSCFDRLVQVARAENLVRWIQIRRARGLENQNGGSERSEPLLALTRTDKYSERDSIYFFAGLFVNGLIK